MPAVAHVESTALYLADFGVAATLTPAAGGAAVAGAVIFDAGGGVSDYGTTSQQPNALAQAATWPAAAEGDLLAIGSASYRVRYVVPEDDAAFKRLHLARV